jgi:hypothetical protein
MSDEGSGDDDDDAPPPLEAAGPAAAAEVRTPRAPHHDLGACTEPGRARQPLADRGYVFQDLGPEVRTARRAPHADRSVPDRTCVRCYARCSHRTPGTTAP